MHPAGSVEHECADDPHDDHSDANENAEIH
jgi:hypothetical protein